MAGNPVRYAEDTLGVHAVWDRSETALKDLAEAHNELVSLQAQKRELVEALLQQEAQIASDQRGLHPEMSQAAFDRHIKTTVALDVECVRIRAAQIEVQNEIDRIENVVREIEFDLRRHNARMEELGGLLRFYAAARSAG